MRKYFSCKLSHWGSKMRTDYLGSRVQLDNQMYKILKTLRGIYAKVLSM